MNVEIFTILLQRYNKKGEKPQNKRRIFATDV